MQAKGWAGNSVCVDAELGTGNAGYAESAKVVLKEALAVRIVASILEIDIFFVSEVCCLGGPTLNLGIIISE